ncbi:MAG: hypothetical protein L7U52_06195 [Alphaproteobacteria bacterium]|nr:hypothetical protein [Alphaproteobacteria bacterium]
MTDTMPTRLSAAIDAADKSIAKTPQTRDATYMPSFRQTTYGLGNLTQSEKKHSEYNHTNMPFIRSRRGAPSAITAENVLKARAALDQAYLHNMAATKREYISNSYADAPQFRNQLDVMA